MSEEWQLEFFKWKDEMEAKFNRLSQAFIELTNKLDEITMILKGLK
ncbi:MAG: hypothetical protein ACTSRG_26965 [Candidatus Helarchaeota archaeon]